MIGSDVSHRLGERVLSSPKLTEAAVLIKSQPGDRNAEGVWEAGPDTETGIRVATVPVTGRDRDLLPEALRLRDVRKFWLTNAADTIEPGQRDGDRVRYDGTEYRVIMLHDWGGFREITCVRPEDEPEVTS